MPCAGMSAAGSSDQAPDPTQVAQALARCADEPIHLPGSIQPHGALLVLSLDGERILQASSNTADVLGTAVEAGQSLREWAGAGDELMPELQQWLINPEVPLARSFRIGGRALQTSAHLGSQGVLLEFEAAAAQETRTLDALYPRVQRFLASVEAEVEVAAVCQAAAREVRELTGFDRVLVYRFDEDWH